MTVKPAALGKYYLGPVVTSSTDTKAEYEALAWTLVGEVVGIGEFGDEANIINHVALSDRRVRKIKGSFDAGNLELEMGFDGDDAGQAAMRAALAADDDYAQKIVLNDGPQGSPSQGTTFYARGQVAMFRVGLPNADSIITARSRVALTSEIVIVPIVR